LLIWLYNYFVRVRVLVSILANTVYRFEG
jgi:hypothetical protein